MFTEEEFLKALDSYGEIIPDPDTQTSVYKPGTKIKESRRRLGLKDLPRDHLIQCIEDYGYFEKKNIFTKNDFTHALEEMKKNQKKEDKKLSMYS